MPNSMLLLIYYRKGIHHKIRYISYSNIIFVNNKIENCHDKQRLFLQINVLSMNNVLMINEFVDIYLIW